MAISLLFKCHGQCSCPSLLLHSQVVRTSCSSFTRTRSEVQVVSQGLGVPMSLRSHWQCHGSSDQGEQDNSLIRRTRATQAEMIMSLSLRLGARSRT
eukprot:3822486-Rhodomonas_salina.1